jgi:hypothetical protein
METINVYRTLAGRPERMRTSISKWLYNIKMDLREIGRQGLD